MFILFITQRLHRIGFGGTLGREALKNDEARIPNQDSAQVAVSALASGVAICALANHLSVRARRTLFGEGAEKSARGGRAPQLAVAFRHSDLGFLSSLGFRHSHRSAS